MWDLPRPGIKPVSPVLAGGLLYHWASREPHIPHLDFCILLFVCCLLLFCCLLCMCTFPSDLQHHRDMVCIHTIRVLTTLGWNNMSACLSRPGTWLPLKGRESGSCSRLYLYLQHVAAHSLHVHQQDHIKSQEEILKVSGKSFMTSRLPGGATRWKGVLIVSVHAEQLSHKQFSSLRHPNSPQAIHNWAMWSIKKEKTICIYPDLFAMKPSCKMGVPWNTPRETLF